MRRHVSAEVLALHREGAVSVRKAGRITAHLSVCAECASIDSGLAAVPGLLAAVQVPPIPDAIAERLQLAIASEAAARAATGASAVAAQAVSVTDSGMASAGTRAEADAVAGSGADAGPDAAGPLHIPGRPDLPDRARRRSQRRRMPQWSSPLVLRVLAAAGAVVIVAGAGLLFASKQTGQETSSGAGAGQPAARRPAPSAGVTGSGVAHGRYAGVSGPVNLNYRLNGKIATARALNTHHNYTRSNLAPLVHKDVASAASLEKGATGTSRSAAPKTVFGGIGVPTLIGCLTRVAAGRSVLVADIARYLGQPATIIVLRPSASSHVLDVVVVGLTCSSAAPEILAELTVPAG